MKFFLIILFILLCLIIVVLGGYLFIGYMLYRLILSRKAKMKVKTEKNLAKLQQEKYFHNDFQKLEILSKDGLNLVGFYKTCQNDKLAILVHGYGGNHYSMIKQAQIFAQKNYDILVIDQRAHGESDGEFVSLGKHESEDLLLWINKMLEHNNKYKIVLYGSSMGASTVGLTLGEKLVNNVVLAIMDSGYDNAAKEGKYLLNKLKLGIFYNLFISYMKKTKNLFIKSIDVCESLKSCKIPVLILSSDKDEMVPVNMSYNLYNTLPNNRCELFVAKDKGHLQFIKDDQDGYKKVIYNFLNKYSL